MHTDMEAGPQVSGAFRVDVSRGANVSRVASEWYSRRGARQGTPGRAA